MRAKQILLLLIVIAILALSVPTLTGFFIKPQNQAFVSRVVDGDTVKLSDGQNVRLLGINTPEKGQAYYQEATDMLRGLVENKTVILETDSEDKDKYGRLLRWIWIGDDLVNLRLVSDGLAFSYMAEGTKYETRINDAQTQAQMAGLGLWSMSDSNFSKCIGIQIFEYDAKGDDRYNLNGEYVTFKNACSYPINMTGWTMADSSNEKFVFQQFVLNSLAKVTMYTGSGQNNQTAFFWGSTKPIWNNNGDSLYLRDNSNNLMVFWNYTGY